MKQLSQGSCRSLRSVTNLAVSKQTLTSYIIFSKHFERRSKKKSRELIILTQTQYMRNVICKNNGSFLKLPSTTQINVEMVGKLSTMNYGILRL